MNSRIDRFILNVSHPLMILQQFVLSFTIIDALWFVLKTVLFCLNFQLWAVLKVLLVHLSSLSELLPLHY